MKYLLINTAVCFLVFANAAFAALPEPEEKLPQCQLKIATAPKGKSYSEMYADIKSVCGNKVAMCEIETKGGLENLNALSVNQADLGIVQLDTVYDMKNSDENLAALQIVLPLHNSLLHILTRMSGYTVEGEKKWGGLMKGTQTLHINKFSDLKGARVALVGSAQWLGPILEQKFHYGMHFIDAETDEQAQEMVKSGQAFALFSMSGWPHQKVVKLKHENDLTLVPFDLRLQFPYKVIKKNYPNLALFRHPFLAVPNVLMTRPFKLTGPNGKNVTALRNCIIEKLPELQEGAYWPGWKEITSVNETFELPRFKADPSAPGNNKKM